MDHAILQYALPFIFDPGNLESRSEQTLHLVKQARYLVVGAKDDVTHTRTLIWVLLTFRVGIIQIAVDSLVIGASGRALRGLR